MRSTAHRPHERHAWDDWQRVHTLVWEVEDDAPLDAVLDEVHQRACEPAVVRKPSGALARHLADDPEFGEGRSVICEAVAGLEQNGGRRVQERVQQRLLLALLRRVRVGRVLREYRGKWREPVEENEAFPARGLR